MAQHYPLRWTRCPWSVYYCQSLSWRLFIYSLLHSIYIVQWAHGHEFLPGVNWLSFSYQLEVAIRLIDYKWLDWTLLSPKLKIFKEEVLVLYYYQLGFAMIGYIFNCWYSISCIHTCWYTTSKAGTHETNNPFRGVETYYVNSFTRLNTQVYHCSSKGQGISK